MPPEMFTLDEARELLPELRSVAGRVIALRADLAEAQLAMARGDRPAIGGLPEVKAAEARMQEALDWFADRGIQVKGIAPLIIDFPSLLDGRPVLLCWLEGEESIGWYHDPEAGFMGRRPLPGVS